MERLEVKALAIGRFDGFHRGHTELFSYLGEGGALAVIKTNGLKITPNQKKFTNLEIFTYELESMKDLSGEKFIDKLMEEFPNLKRIVVGYDFKFGKNRSFSAEDLKDLFSGEVVIVDEFKLNKTSVHTKEIKTLLKLGNITKANNLLGRNFEILGKVIKGQGLGAKKLYPTINLEISNDQFLPKDGVYLTYANFQDRRFKSLSFIGTRLSTDGKFSIETHILEEFYSTPEFINLEFVEFLRDNAKFENLNDLKTQISKDIKRAKETLNER